MDFLDFWDVSLCECAIRGSKKPVVCLPVLVFQGAMTSKGYPEQFEPGARRFDSGGRLNPIGLPMLDLAIQQVVKWQKVEIISVVAQFTSMIASTARALGLDVPPSHAPHIVGLRWDGRVSSKSPEQFAMFLKSHKVYVSVRAKAVRISVGVYVTVQMVHRLCTLMGLFFQILDSEIMGANGDSIPMSPTKSRL